MQSLKYNTNRHVYRTEADSQTQRTDLRQPRKRAAHRREELGVWCQGMRMTASAAAGWVDSKALLCGTRN